MPDLDYRHVADALVLPIRLEILRAMLAGPPGGAPGWSAKAIFDALGIPLARASHHVRALGAAGLIERVGDRRRRGAIETFHRLACRAPGPVDHSFDRRSRTER